ncbi:MAG: RIP metalloprotease RseP [Candidatus Omnitrophota bacterium]|nr:RIP metalloprotease RseP [Candidatus Omnitrophota bacterium]
MGARGGVEILLTAIIVIFVFSVLILIHEAGHLVAAKRAGVKVEAFSLGFGKRLCGKEIGGTDYRISMLPFGGYLRMAGEDPSEASGGTDELASKPVGKRFWVMASGALTNYVFAFILFSVVFMAGIPTLSNEVGEVLKGYPGEASGIKVGDKILSISGSGTEYWDDIVEAIKKRSLPGEKLDIEIERGARVLSIKVTPNISTITNIFGQKISRPMVGIAPKNKIISVSYNPVQAMYHGGKRLLVLSGMTYKGIWMLITGGMPMKTSVSGPIGIAHLMGQAAELGIIPLLLITAHVSMALAIFNLLPFPVLDGGHIIFLVMEKIKGRPLSVKVQEWITQIAVFALITFAVMVSWNDIVKFTPLGDRANSEVKVEEAGK